MTGGLMLLSLYGEENLFLTGNPEITFFRSVHLRYTHFAMEMIEQFIPNLEQPQFNKSTTIKLSKSGDLLADCHMRIATTPATLEQFKYVYNAASFQYNSASSFFPMEQIVKETSFRFNDTIIDNYDCYWTHFHTQINNNAEQLNQWNMQSNFFNTIWGSPVIAATQNYFYVPFRFFFCKNSKNFIPLISLQNVDLFIDVYLSKI